jgi:GTP-binding protein EngB required for normal cell division
MGDQRLNLVVFGATGVGKSTFLNYLLDKEAFETSLSRPSTGYGFWGHDVHIRGFPVRLIDSWGLEAGKSDEWEKYLFAELTKRESSLEITDCFHAVCYVISATSNRVLDFDLEILRRLIIKGYSVIVVLTKAAKVEAKVIDEMTGSIRTELGDEVPVVAVNSKSETLMDGHLVGQFGVEEFERQIVLRFWETIRRKIPILIGEKLRLEVEEAWDKKMLDYIAKIDQWDLANTEKVKAHILQKANELTRGLVNKSVELRKSEVQKARNMYRALAECMDHTGSWELPTDNQPLDVRFEATVSDPSFFEKVAQVLSFGMFDPTTESRRKFREAAKAFSTAIKKEIEQKLVPQVRTSIGTIEIDVKRLPQRKNKGDSLLVALLFCVLLLGVITIVVLIAVQLQSR